MKLLDLYIIKKYLKTFFFTVLILSMIATIIDFSEKVEKFMREPVTVWEVISQYYLNFLPYINALLWPLYCMISVIFFTSQLARGSEIVAIYSSGISVNRLLRPYLITALFLGGIHLAMNHTIIPRGNAVKFTFENTYIYKSNDKGNTRNVHIFLSEDSKIFIRYFRKSQNKGSDIRIETFKDNRLQQMLVANSIQWQEETGSWLLKDYETRVFSEDREYYSGAKGAELDTVLALVPSDFTRFINAREMITSKEMKEFIRRENARGIGNTKQFEVELYRRTAEPFTLIILTIIGFVVASQKVRGGMGLHLAIGVGLGALFVVMSKFAHTFANSQEIPALLGVWIPNIIFTTVAAILLYRAQQR